MAKQKITHHSTWWLWENEVTVIAITDNWIVAIPAGTDEPVVYARAKFILDATLLRRKSKQKQQAIVHIPGQMTTEEAA